MHRTFLRLITTISTCLVPALAFAHPGLGNPGLGNHVDFAGGFAHPLGGLDHILAMVAVGMFAAHLGGRALVLVPATFVLVMAAAGVLGMSGVGLPFVELGVALSVIVLGAAIAFRLQAPVIVAMAAVGFFAIFHGHAHGTEMVGLGAGALYGAGFVLATALLHAVGIGIGLAIRGLGTVQGKRLYQLSGSAMALAGVAILAGIV
jgi:urease accessory protein